MSDRPPYENEQDPVDRLYGIRPVSVGRGYRYAVGRFLLRAAVVSLVLSGLLILFSFLGDRF